MVGRRKLDDGLVNIFGGIPGDRRTGVPGKRVGYMPQVRNHTFSKMNTVGKWWWSKRTVSKIFHSKIKFGLI